MLLHSFRCRHDVGRTLLNARCSWRGLRLSIQKIPTVRECKRCHGSSLSHPGNARWKGSCGIARVQLLQAPRLCADAETLFLCRKERHTLRTRAVGTVEIDRSIGKRMANRPSVGGVGEPTVRRKVETAVPRGTESGRFGEDPEYTTSRFSWRVLFSD